MRHRVYTLGLAALFSAFLAASPTLAQRQTLSLALPDVSPRAELAQTVGMTDLRLVYFRPAVNGRPVWGSLVPYGQVWRTGANENTVFTVSTDVKVEGQPLAAGSYGLHTIPEAERWTVIFSRDTTAWGSFSYDEAQDALRVSVTPETAPHAERLQFSFDDVSPDSTTLALRWEALRVPLRLEVDSDANALASIREQLKGLAQFSWVGWDQAANWALQNETAYEEALGWTERSLQNEERFDNLATKAQLLERTERAAEAAEVMDRAMAIANAAQLHNYGRQLLGEGKVQEALAIFERNARENPDTWFVEVGMARGYSAQGDFARAASNMRAALERAPEDQREYVAGLVERLEHQEDIN